jgi:hydroxymethylglutaryl-CoA synthase
VWSLGASLASRRVVLFSYGSGLASSLFSLRVRSDAESQRALTNMQEKLALKQRLDARVQQTPQAFYDNLARRAHVHALLSFQPSAEVNVQPNAFYLTEKDSKGRRFYAQADAEGKAKPAEKSAVTAPATAANGSAHSAS